MYNIGPATALAARWRVPAAGNLNTSVSTRKVSGERTSGQKQSCAKEWVTPCCDWRPHPHPRSSLLGETGRQYRTLGLKSKPKKAWKHRHRPHDRKKHKEQGAHHRMMIRCAYTVHLLLLAPSVTAASNRAPPDTMRLSCLDLCPGLSELVWFKPLRPTSLCGKQTSAAHTRSLMSSVQVDVICVEDS